MEGEFVSAVSSNVASRTKEFKGSQSGEWQSTSDGNDHRDQLTTLRERLRCGAELHRKSTQLSLSLSTDMLQLSGTWLKCPSDSWVESVCENV